MVNRIQTLKRNDMKTARIAGIILALVLISLGGKQVFAQQKDEQAAKEMELQEKKLQLEQQKMEQEMQMKKMEIEFSERARAAELEARAREAGKASVVYPIGTGTYEPMIVLPGSSAQLTLRNNFQGNTDSTTGTFDVEQGTRQFRCMINGKVRSGTISIRVFYPGGKTFKDLTINSSAEINFQQSLTIKEGEEGKYLGSWKYEIKADKAEGNYMLQISTN
jgi:hypothetical protein